MDDHDKTLIVNADDLGYDTSTNAAIIRSFEQGLCSSATLMANMDGFEEACDLIHKHGLINHVGIHINISEGKPLTERIQRLDRFCNEEGEFILRRSERVILLSDEEKEALAAEFRAQIQRLRSRSINITHVDSHKNIHEEWGIFTVLLPVVKEAGIPYVRLSRNIGKRSAWMKTHYRHMLNARLILAGLARTRHFGSMKDFEYEQRIDTSITHSCEIMVHPVFDAQGCLFDLFCKTSLEASTLKELESQGPVSFSGSRYNAPAKLATP